MNIFQHIKSGRPKSNKFDLSHERKMSLNMNGLYPMLVQEVIPGDNFRVSSEVMMRVAPLLAPIMHRVNVTVHYFFVPNRLVWDEWEDFITGGREGTSAPVWPYIRVADDIIDNGALAAGSLWDFLGLPTAETDHAPASAPVNVSAIPFRAYQLIYDEYYRDQNLEAPLDISKASNQVTGAELTKILTRRTRAWEKDYFTSALPWAQRGGDVSVPVESVVTHARTQAGGTPVDTSVISTDSSGELSDDTPVPIELYGGSGDLSINELRRSIRLQEWLEKMARGGARYAEQLLSMFGVMSDDARLQRPEYLGGGRQPVVISEVLSTYQDPTGVGDPQANMAGHGFSLGKTNRFSRKFKEHGYVLGLISVLPKTAYMQGVPRHFTREDKLDYAWPQFANIGEQEILSKELYSDYIIAGGNDVFGYTPRYSEYKYQCDSVHGDFRTNLSFWHMARIFDDRPVLNADFVKADATHRIFAVDDPLVNKLYCQCYNRISAIRPLPYFGTPMI